MEVNNLSLSQYQYKKAETILEKNITSEEWEKLRDIIKEKGNHWLESIHFTWGMWCRNCLRQNGFIDKESKSGNLDDIYGDIVLYIIKKKCPGIERYLNENSP